MKCKIINLEMFTDDRIRLADQISNRMEELEYKKGDFKSLDLGFELDPNWPFKGELNIEQLVVLSQKLKMKIVVNRLSMEKLVNNGQYIGDNPECQNGC